MTLSNKDLALVIVNLKNLRFYDNGGKTFDRYTVLYMDCAEGRGLYGARGMSANPFHPQGFGQSCAAMPGAHLGKRITFEALPHDCQRAIVQDLKTNASLV